MTSIAEYRWSGSPAAVTRQVEEEFISRNRNFKFRMYALKHIGDRRQDKIIMIDHRRNIPRTHSINLQQHMLHPKYIMYDPRPSVSNSDFFTSHQNGPLSRKESILSCH
ncbi:hypothetical protein QL285_095823 [Trifolium repens]|nr:hypothetical protein QL285_095823 [Trifolium repens]